MEIKLSQTPPNPWPPSPNPQGVLHRYNDRLTAFQHTPHQPQSRAQSTGSPKNYLLWVGGLGDGLLTVNYPTYLANTLPQHWSLVEVLTSASYRQFGTSWLARDCDELAECVEYFRGLQQKDSTESQGSAGEVRNKIVLMGHSTGSQDALFYVVGRHCETRPPVDGIILQAPVSDREGFYWDMPREKIDLVVNKCREMVAAGHAGDCLPFSYVETLFTESPMSAYRWLSLLSPDKDGDDDLFSSDFDEQHLSTKSFGRIPARTPLLILYGGADGAVPDFVDKEELVRKWMRVTKRGGGVVDEEFGGVVKGASHNLNGDGVEVVEDVCARVRGFLGKI